MQQDSHTLPPTPAIVCSRWASTKPLPFTSTSRPPSSLSTPCATAKATLTDTGALMADTGKFTGRSPKDRFVVKDANTEDSVWWGDINIPFDADKFDQLHQKMVAYLADKEMYVREAYAGANPDYQLKLRVVNEQAWHNLFCYNMFLRPAEGADTSPGRPISASSAPPASRPTRPWTAPASPTSPSSTSPRR